MVRIQKINLLFVLLFFVSTFANAQTEVDGVYYKIIDGNTVEVCAVPNIADLTPYSGIIVIPPTVQIGEKQYNVTKIGEKAFENATLTSLSIPFSVKTIGNNAFSGCSKDNFKKVYFADMTHLTTISYASMYSSPIMYAQEVWLTDKNKKVTEITIKNNVNPYAFRGATWLTKVTFEGNNVTIIANDAFYGCTNLTEIELPSELTNIGVAAFRDCTGLTSITIPASATSIGKETFWNCTSLKNLVINAPLTALPNSMFLSCGDLTELTINLENLVEIGEKTFSGCKSLKSFPFKESILEDIQTCAFLECKSLTKIELPTTIKTIGDNAFENCSSLTELTMAEGYSSNLQIGGSTFKGCKLLTSFPFEESQLEVIPASAFEGCGFTTLELPAILRAIRGSAFKDCNNLTTLTIPAPDTDEPLQIGAYAFSNNTNLKYIHSNAQTAPGVATGAENSIFDGNTGIQLYYDKDYDEVYGYDKLPWSDFNPKPFKENTITYYVYKDDRVLHEGPYPQQVGQETPIVKAKPTWGDGWEFEKWIDEIPQYMPESESGLEINGYFTKEYTSTDGVKYRLYSYIPKEARVIGYYNSPKDIVIPSSIQFNEIDYNVVAIEDEAFKGAKSLETVDLSNATTNIGKSIFEDCSALTSVKLPTDLTIIPDNMFSGCSALSTLDIPSKVTKIGVSAFEGCSALEKIMLPAVLTEISERMFYGCSALSTLDIPSNVTKIGASAFEGCTIYNIDHLPSGLQEIGKSAFNSCGIEKMTLPSSITSMGDNVFQSCTKLIEVVFDNEMYLTTLPAYTFSGCSNLKSFTLPTSTRTIGINAFADCISLNYLTLDNIETINSNAFTHCDNLKAITLSIIETLGNLAFSYCGNVKMITIESEKLPVVGESTFADIYSKATLCVKNAENYRKHEIWGKFKNIESIVSSLPKLIYMLDGKEIVEFSNDYKPGTPIEKKGEKLGLSDELSEKYNPQGREFKGWDGEPDVMPNKDVVVNGWLKYQLTYMAEGTESVLASDGFFYDDEIVEPKDQLNKEGFTYKVLDPIKKTRKHQYGA